MLLKGEKKKHRRKRRREGVGLTEEAQGTGRFLQKEQEKTCLSTAPAKVPPVKRGMLRRRMGERSTKGRRVLGLRGSSF